MPIVQYIGQPRTKEPIRTQRKTKREDRTIKKSAVKGFAVCNNIILNKW